MAFGADRLDFHGQLALDVPSDHLRGRHVVRFVAFCAGCVDLVPLVSNVRGRGANVFVVGMSRADTVTLDATNFLGQMQSAYLLSHKGYVADVTGSIGSERIDHDFGLGLCSGSIRTGRLGFSFGVLPERAGAGVCQVTKPQARQGNRKRQDTY
jgi:hypothetical protein